MLKEASPWGGKHWESARMATFQTEWPWNALGISSGNGCLVFMGTSRLVALGSVYRRSYCLRIPMKFNFYLLFVQTLDA